MADGFSLAISGLPEVESGLIELGSIAGERVMRSTLFSASKPILDKTIAGLTAYPRGSGALAKATRRVYLKQGAGGLHKFALSTGSTFAVAVAPKNKSRAAVALANLYYKRRKRPVKGVFWGHLLEWGHRIGNRASGRLARTSSLSKKVKRRHVGFGRVSGHLIFTRAAEASAQEAISLFRTLIAQRTKRALRKMGVKTKRKRLRFGKGIIVTGHQEE